MKLEEIVRADADYCELVEVEVDLRMPTVCIRDLEGIHDDIFMQGDDASQFAEQYVRMQEELPNVDCEKILLHLAKPYVENIWN